MDIEQETIDTGQWEKIMLDRNLLLKNPPLLGCKMSESAENSSAVSPDRSGTHNSRILLLIVN